MQAGRLEDTEKTGDEEAQRHRDTEIQLFKFSESPLRLVSVTHRPRFFCVSPSAVRLYRGDGPRISRPYFGARRLIRSMSTDSGGALPVVDSP
jgi:hypothetical protein